MVGRLASAYYFVLAVFGEFWRAIKKRIKGCSGTRPW